MTLDFMYAHSSMITVDYTMIVYSHRFCLGRLNATIHPGHSDLAVLLCAVLADRVVD